VGICTPPEVPTIASQTIPPCAKTLSKAHSADWKKLRLDSRRVICMPKPPEIRGCLVLHI
jgi:hypothetical protein